MWVGQSSAFVCCREQIAALPPRSRSARPHGVHDNPAPSLTQQAGPVRQDAGPFTPQWHLSARPGSAKPPRPRPVSALPHLQASAPPAGHPAADIETQAAGAGSCLQHCSADATIEEGGNASSALKAAQHAQEVRQGSSDRAQGTARDASIDVQTGVSAVLLPAGEYEAAVADPQLKVMFVSEQGHAGAAQRCPLHVDAGDTVCFRVSPTAPHPGATMNRFDYLPHSLTVDDIYTDNTACAFVAKGGSGQLTTGRCFDVYTRRRPRTWVRS